MHVKHSNYLESKVLTAPPHRLHLLLLEGAIRFSRQSQEALARDDQVAAASSLLRVMEIVGELLAGIRANKSELNSRLAELYWYLFRRVTEAKIYSDAQALAEAIRLLEFERETWQQLCDKLGAEEQSTAGGEPGPPSLSLQA